jgi:hypothetical protein
MTEFVLVKDLPPAVQAALESVSYGSKDIKVKAAESVHLGDAGAGNGRKAFVVLVNLDNGTHQTIMGSWGGQNMFDKTNPVDNDRGVHALPGNGLAITGSIGTGPTWATIHIPASMTARILPTGSGIEVTDDEKNVLACYLGYTSAYRKELFARKGVKAEVFDGLVARGLIKRNKAGATSITTDGKNVVGYYRAPYSC